MNKTAIALASALLLAGASGSAAAQSYYDDGRYYDDRVIYYESDMDRDGISDRYDRYDNRYSRTDRRYSRDRDCDGVPDRYDYNDRRNVRDRDCDGVPNRFDRIDDRTYRARQSYSAPRYVAPYGYRGTSFSVGSYLPRDYYGSSYYIDYRPYGLAPPPYGYSWVRVGNDVYLTSTRTGLIAEVIYSLFR